MKKVSLILIVIFCIITGIMLISDEEDIENIGTDTYTVMIYMCASDLESDGGYATSDISEMLNATIDDKVNLIIETGGTTQWQDYGISNETNQIYKIENKELKLIKDNLGIQEMTNPQTLTDFIKYCKNEYPADKYSLILWDHGGGAISGFGYDENYENSEDTLTLDELRESLKTANVNFEFIGFDACLMGNIETAYSVKDFAKYLIASEETEPGGGWNYKELLNKISKNTSADTIEISKAIVDSFIDDNNGFFSFEDATLSVIDLQNVDELYSILCKFMKNIEEEELDQNRFSVVSKAIGNTKSFAEGEYDIIDLVDFAKQINNENSQELIKQVSNTVKYYKNTDLVENTNGISIYIPFSDLSYYEDMIKIYRNIDMNEEYINILTKFVNQLVGGKENSYKINSHTYVTDSEDYEQYDWYNESIVNEFQDNYEELQPEELEIINKGNYYALEISEDDWNMITNITCEVMYDDGYGYIDLGSDDYFEIDEENNLKITFDNTWIVINEQVVPYYTYESTEKYSKGKVKILYNGVNANLVIVWNENNQNGKILGVELEKQYGNTTINSKGLKKLKNGDRIEFICDYYSYDGEYEDSYILGDEIIVGDSELQVGYEDIGESIVYVYYKIIDIYNNVYYTEAVVYENN